MKIITRKEFKERANLVEDALFGKASAQDYEGMKALAPLVTALCNNNTACVCDGGPYVFYKIKNQDGDFVVFYKRLTVGERRILNNNPTLLGDPHKLLENIKAGIEMEKKQADKLRDEAKKIESRNN